MSGFMQGVIPGSLDMRIMLLTGFVGVVMLGAFAMFWKETKLFLGNSKWLGLYALPLLSIIALLLNYGGPLHVSVFITMIVVSVLWQDVLTFGLFQSYIRKNANSWKTILIVGTLFGLGHLIAFAPDFLSALNAGWFALFIVGYVFAWLREKTGNIYVLNVFHVTFLLSAAAF